MTLTITIGASVITARPKFSSMRLMPGPLVAVMTFLPVKLAPIKDATALISSSNWTNLRLNLGNLEASLSAISVAGVMGYEAK
jgi:hypothetical protein